MLVCIIVVSRRMNCVGRQFHLVENVFLRSLDALHDVDMSHTSDSPRKCDMTMIVHIIVVSRRMKYVGRPFHLADSVFLHAATGLPICGWLYET